MMFSFYCIRSRVASVFLLFLVITSGFAYAQGSGSIRGVITDKTDGEALVGANVIIQGTSLGAAADIEGHFYIHGVPAGTHQLNITYIGYNPLTVEVTVAANQTLEVEYQLQPRVLEGEEVVITGQAQGQLGAINQQLSLNTIANVVARDRIKELPDVNAAESIGRLPGVSIQRSGGEATKVEIRGLSPKYNTVTVNGVRVPATGGDDRSVDLSLISSNMLDGITVKKANTPDMDADALGGTIDLRLREAPDRLQFNISAQGGYNELQDYYGNYNFTGSISNRFFDKRLGIIGNFNLDNYDRSADKLQASYRWDDIVKPSELRMRDEDVRKGRTGAGVLLDYLIPSGKVTLNSFYNRLHSDNLYRVNRMDLVHNSHYYDMEDRSDHSTSIFTGALAGEQDYGWLQFDLGISRTSSTADSPRDLVLGFAQENGAFKTTEIDEFTYPYEIPTKQVIDSNGTGLQSIYIYSTKLEENETALQLNVKFPFTIGSDISGFIKTGGKLRWLDRSNDQEQNGRDGLQYGSTGGVNNILTPTLKYLSANHPDLWNWISDSTIVRQNGVFPITRVLSDYTRNDFMNGEYPIGFVINQSLMNQMADALFSSGQTLNYSIGSIGRDYDGTEQYQAAYVMAEVNLWNNFLTIIPGVRYERDRSEYHGQRYRETTVNNAQGPPTDLVRLTSIRENDFFLPIIHAIVNPYEWLKVRLARTETLTRPDYINYAPITSINSYQSYISANNSQLKPAHAVNYDASVSVYHNYIGFFTASGFYKDITDLIFQTSYILKSGVPLLPGLNIPDTWLKGVAPQMDTYINNPGKANYKGFELDWQTQFWYLPSFLSGMILNVNYTRIFSEVEKLLYNNKEGGIIPGTRPPRRANLLVDTVGTYRMPDQPAHIVNITLGYDYKGFSARVSFLYQTDKTSYIHNYFDELSSFSASYKRWDATLQQKLDWGLQLFVNFSNLNAVRDKYYSNSNVDLSPTFIEQYGFTMDFGVRFNL